MAADGTAGVMLNDVLMPSSSSAPVKNPPKKRGRPPKNKSADTESKKQPSKKKKQGDVAGASDQSATKPKRARYRTQKQVHELLKNMGVRDPERVSACLKEGIRKNYIKILPPSEDSEGKYGLDQVILSDKCHVCCSQTITAKLSDILYQGEVGDDYEDAAPDSNVRCPDEDCGCGFYVSDLCMDSPRMDTGKFYNHCTMCPGFGRCIGDYRETHCSGCNKHFFTGLSGFPCPTCNPGEFEGFM